MEAKKKFRLKRQYKTLMWVGYTCVAFFFLVLIATIVVRAHSDADWNKPVIMLPLVIIWLLPGFTGAFCLIFTGHSQQQLRSYMRDIQVYRARNFAYKTIEYLQDGKLQLAIDEYIKCNWYPEKSLDDYVYGMLIQACYLSNDNELKEKGVKRINNLKDRFNPDKIVFN